MGLPGKWVFSPLYEWRTRLPVVGRERVPGLRRRRATESGRLPTVSTLDFSLARPWHFRKYRFSAGLKVYNALRHRGRARRAEQHHVARLRHVLQPDPAIDWVDYDQQAAAGTRRGKRKAKQAKGRRQKAEGGRQKAEDGILDRHDSLHNCQARRPAARLPRSRCSRWEPPGWEPRSVGGRRRCSWLARPPAWCSITPPSASPRPGGCSSRIAGRRAAGADADAGRHLRGLFSAARGGMFFGQPLRGSSRRRRRVLAGAFIFGLGMQLGGGCASGRCSAGGGSTRMLITLAFFIVGSLIGTAHTAWWNAMPALRRRLSSRCWDRWLRWREPGCVRRHRVVDARAERSGTAGC